MIVGIAAVALPWFWENEKKGDRDFPGAETSVSASAAGLRKSTKLISEFKGVTDIFA